MLRAEQCCLSKLTACQSNARCFFFYGVVVMEGRCAVETWTEFGSSGSSSYTPRIKFGFETDVFLCTGGDEVYIFNTQERKLTAVLQSPGPVTDLVVSHDNQLLYVSCTSGVYCVNLPPLLSKATSLSVDASSGPAELKISTDSLVIAEESVLSLLLVDSVLLILSQRDASWFLSLYKTPKHAQSGSCELLSSFSLPVVSAVVHGDTQGKTGVRRGPVLICVYSGETKSPSSSSSSSSSETTFANTHFCLEPILFKLLFGIDTALARSPVILYGLPDGRLCFLPLRLPGSQLSVLHSLEQPVVFVGASVATETGPGLAQCLVAVGEQGRVLLMKTDKGGPEGGAKTAGFIEACVPGPVVCGFVDKHHLYYSSGSDLLVLDLSEGSSGREGQERNEGTNSRTAATIQSPTSLNVCRVVALAAPEHNTTGGAELLGLSVRGQLQRIILPAGREDAGLSTLPSTQVGRGVRDLLSAIGDVCERHLNQVLNISSLLVTSSDSEEHLPMQEKQIRCHAITRWSKLLQKDSLSLTCVLDNSSPYVLERGWTLSIAVFPLYSSSSSTEGGQSSSSGFSFPFHNLHPGETLEVSLPLAAAGDTSFPMRVNCSLIFSLSSLLGEEEAAQLPGLPRSCLSLPLNTLTVDWLHALQVNGPATHPINKNITYQSSDITTNGIQAFLNSRRTRCVRQGAGGGEVTSKMEREQYSASVRLSSELVKDTLVFKGSDLDPHGPNVAPQNLSFSLMDWLLYEGPGGVRIGRERDKTVLSSSAVTAQGPNGDTVKLTAKETLLQRAPDRAASTKGVQSSGFRQALQRAERLLQQIQQSRVSGAFGVGVSTGQMTRTLLSVFAILTTDGEAAMFKELQGEILRGVPTLQTSFITPWIPNGKDVSSIGCHQNHLWVTLLQVKQFVFARLGAASRPQGARRPHRRQVDEGEERCHTPGNVQIHCDLTVLHGEVGVTLAGHGQQVGLWMQSQVNCPQLSVCDNLGEAGQVVPRASEEAEVLLRLQGPATVRLSHDEETTLRRSVDRVSQLASTAASLLLNQGSAVGLRRPTEGVPVLQTEGLTLVPKVCCETFELISIITPPPRRHRGRRRRKREEGGGEKERDEAGKEGWMGG
ncbi:hypothetical protein INR49_013817, partial [Caranx melampygus]